MQLPAGLKCLKAFILLKVLKRQTAPYASQQDATALAFLNQ